MRLSVLALSVILSLSVASVARADELVPDAAPAPARVYYGWQNLGMDAAAIGIFVATLDADSDAGNAFALGSLGLYALGSPMIHLLHGQNRAAGTSLLLRVGLPLALGGLTYAVMDKEDCSNSAHLFCGLGEVVIPVYVGMLGMGAAMLTDDFGLAYEKVETPTWGPTMRATNGGMTFGVAGVF
jgi:hypothetical protein